METSIDGFGQILKKEWANNVQVLFGRISEDDPMMDLYMEVHRWKQMGSPDTISIGITNDRYNS